MAKKDKKKSKKDKSRPVEAVGAVRSAVERTFQATAEGAQTTRDRAAELVDDVAGAAAGRVRGVFDEQLKALHREVEALSRRLAELEKSRRGTTASASKPAGSRATTARKPAARKTAGARKPAARKTTAARKPAATRSASTTRKTAATRSASTARKPAAKPSTPERKSS
jgi:hypothetical protein